ARRGGCELHHNLRPRPRHRHHPGGGAGSRRRQRADRRARHVPGAARWVRHIRRPRSPQRYDFGELMTQTSDAPTSFATSVDGARTAFDLAGTGPGLLLLHGGGQTRRVWREHGYVARLRESFTVVSVDIRGSGESDKPDGVEAYAIDRMTDDILAVADAA